MTKPLTSNTEGLTLLETALRSFADIKHGFEVNKSRKRFIYNLILFWRCCMTRHQHGNYKKEHTDWRNNLFFTQCTLLLSTPYRSCNSYYPKTFFQLFSEICHDDTHQLKSFCLFIQLVGMLQWNLLRLRATSAATQKLFPSLMSTYYE